MHWPVSLSSDKCANAILASSLYPPEKGELLEKRGWKQPETGPWIWCGYWWKWGCEDKTDISKIRVYGKTMEDTSTRV